MSMQKALMTVSILSAKANTTNSKGRFQSQKIIRKSPEMLIKNLLQTLFRPQTSSCERCLL